MSRKRLALLLTLLYALGIGVLSHIPGLQTPRTLPWSDKLLHALLYAGFGTCLLLSVSAHRPHWKRWQLWGTVLLLGALYAATDEWHQRFVPGRIPDATDWAADVVGLTASLLLSRLWLPWWIRTLR
jgi:VanZ family protein